MKQDRKGNHRKSVNCPKRTYSHSEIGHSHGDNWVSVRSSLHNKMGQSFRDNLIELRHVDGNDVCCQVRILEMGLRENIFMTKEITSRLIEDSIALICSGDISTSYCGHGHADSFIRLAELHKS